jgi:mercuric ion binding protein
MQKYLLTIIIIIIFGLTAAVSADTIRATVNGMVCGFCATGIEKTFKAQPEVKTVDVDLENKLVTIQTKQGQILEDSKIKKLLGNAGYSVVAVARQK